MERTITVTASIIALIATLGAADAGTVSRSHRSPVPASGQAAHRLNSLDSSVHFGGRAQCASLSRRSEVERLGLLTDRIFIAAS